MWKALAAGWKTVPATVTVMPHAAMKPFARNTVCRGHLFTVMSLRQAWNRITTITVMIITMTMITGTKVGMTTIITRIPMPIILTVQIR